MPVDSSTACASCSNPWLERHAPRNPMLLAPRRVRATHHDFLAGVGMHVDQEVLRHSKQSVEDGRVDRRIIEAILAGLVERHARIEEQMEPALPEALQDPRA